jgi:hypothetical protein
MMNKKSSRHEENAEALHKGHTKGAQRLYEGRRKKRWVVFLRGI